MSRPAVFLDRDGVLNEVRMHGGVASTPRSVGDLAIVDGARACLEALRRGGFALIVVSNQPDIARGDLSREVADAINDALRGALPVDAVYICPHDARDGCTCRKPKPGMILTGAAEWDINLEASWLIGDRWVDLAAAAAAGVGGILLESPWSWEPTSLGPPPPDLRPAFAASTLEGCVAYVLARSAPALGAAPPPEESPEPGWPGAVV